MAGLKTKATEISIENFLDSIADEQVRDECSALIKIMKKATGEKPKMWGPSIIGFGKYHYQYESGHEGDMCLVGFSPRKGKISLYVKSAHSEDLLEKLGKHKAAKGCIYIKKVSDINIPVLDKIIERTVKYLKKKYPNE
jgi:hypothetical protein